MEDALPRPRREKWSSAIILYSLRPVSVVSGVRNASNSFVFNGVCYKFERNAEYFTLILTEGDRPPTIYRKMLLKTGCVLGISSIPVNETRLDHRALAAAVGPSDGTPIPLAHGEHERTGFTVRDFIVEGGIRYVQFETSRAAGFTEALRIAQLTEQPWGNARPAYRPRAARPSRACRAVWCLRGRVTRWARDRPVGLWPLPQAPRITRRSPALRGQTRLRHPSRLGLCQPVPASDLDATLARAPDNRRLRFRQQNRPSGILSNAAPLQRWVLLPGRTPAVAASGD
jgi:hypothetical protein